MIGRSSLGPGLKLIKAANPLTSPKSFRFIKSVLGRGWQIGAILICIETLGKFENYYTIASILLVKIEMRSAMNYEKGFRFRNFRCNEVYKTNTVMLSMKILWCNKLHSIIL